MRNVNLRHGRPPRCRSTKDLETRPRPHDSATHEYTAEQALASRSVLLAGWETLSMRKFVKVIPDATTSGAGNGRTSTADEWPGWPRSEEDDILGKITGFLEFDRALPAPRPIEERCEDWRELEQGSIPREDTADSGGALHGLRDSLLPHGLPARKHHPRLERPRVPTGGGAKRSIGFTRRTTSPSSPGASVRRHAKRRACSTSTTTPSPSSRSRSRSSIMPWSSRRG